MLYQHSYGLPPRLSAELLWTRFVNVYGRRGKNIAAHLHMEHLNRLAKDATKNLGAIALKNLLCELAEHLEH